MRAVQFEQVEAGLVGAGRSVGELLPDHVQLGRGQLMRHLADPGQVGQRGRPGHRPVPGGQWLVHALPHQPGRSLPPGVTELDADLGLRLTVHELGDPAPLPGLLIGVDAGAARGDPAVRRHADHLGHHQPGAAERLPAQVHQVEVTGQAILGHVHVHRGHDHPVDQLQVPQPERLEHRRAHLAGTHPARGLVPGEPAVHRRDELRVADPQVVVGDPAAPGDDVERELDRVLPGVLAQVLEPLQAGLRRPLSGQHHGPAFFFIGLQRGADLSLFVQAGGQGERVLHGQLGARADGEVRGVRGVAEQHDVAVPPVLVADRGEADPPGVVQQHLVAVQDVREQLADQPGRPLVGLAGRQVCRPARRSRPAATRSRSSRR